MIIGAHSVIYSTDPEADQRFLRDVLRLPAVDGGGGYLILGLPPAEASVHPASKDNLQHELYLLCDNIEAFIAEMRKHSVPPFITAFALVAFSPLKQLRQPVRLFVIGLANGAIVGLISGLGVLRGIFSSRTLLFIVGISIAIGAFFSLLASSETISQKKSDELVRKSDDQSWRA
jgi:hypothetical protein